MPLFIVYYHNICIFVFVYLLSLVESGNQTKLVIYVKEQRDSFLLESRCKITVFHPFSYSPFGSIIYQYLIATLF